MSGKVATTQWSQVLAARDGSDTEARAALEGLCQTYWQPLYAYMRHFLSHERDRERALKRGGGTTTLSLDVEAGEAGYALRLEHHVEEHQPAIEGIRSTLADLKAP